MKENTRCEAPMQNSCHRSMEQSLSFKNLTREDNTGITIMGLR